jgi:hypothetical protein
MNETSINTTPAHALSIDQRLDEIAQLMLRGVIRLKNKSNKETGSTGLSGALKHSCDKGDQYHE